MQAIKADERQKSDRRIAEELLNEYAQYQATRKEAGSEMRAIELSLLELAEKHPEWFDRKTANFESGKLKWKVTSKLELPDDFDMAKFKRKFPHLVKTTDTIPIAKIRSYQDDPSFGKWGIEITTKDVFDVEA